ncbi:MAG: hypothetical protein HQM00_02065, partial [Magnetococcales bacterium]|nr:hypothetical protein [Magnetococcales bacterium]
MAQKKIHDSPSSRVMAYRKRRLEGMKRVEIWLTDEELEQLDRVAETTGTSRARVVAHLLTGRLDGSPEPELPFDPPESVTAPSLEKRIAPAASSDSTAIDSPSRPDAIPSAPIDAISPPQPKIVAIRPPQPESVLRSAPPDEPTKPPLPPLDAAHPEEQAPPAPPEMP